MRPSKKLMTRLLPTCLALLAMLLVACGGTTTTTPTTSGKATPDKQVLNMPFSKRYFRYQDVRSGSVDGRAIHRCYQPGIYGPGAV